MPLTPQMLDRAVGVLVASAAGDALGVPYEPSGRPPAGEPEQLGGGFGNYAPAEWSDDTQMACVIAKVAASGADLRTPESLDAIAQGFLDWYASGPGDVGNQTRYVLSRTEAGPDLAERMTAVAAAFAAGNARAAGNGSLMRTGPVALAYVGKPAADLAKAARAISNLTHFDPMAGDACVLWSLAIEHTVRTGELDVRVGLPFVDASWVELLDAAEAGSPDTFANNGWSVAALQAAWSAVHGAESLRDALVRAVHAGGDTDTVAAVAGSIAGAKWGGSAVPFEWRRRLHGWPGLRARDLTSLAVLALQGGSSGGGWPLCERMTEYDGPRPLLVEHPDDPGVLLGNAAALQPGVADAVVSLCRLGIAQAPLAGIAPEDQAEIWFVDDEDSNLDVARVIREAALTVKLLRDEGKTVLLHCVHAHCRTPVVGAAYGALVTGTTTQEALDRVLAVMPQTDPRRSIVKELLRMTFDAGRSTRG